MNDLSLWQRDAEIEFDYQARLEKLARDLLLGFYVDDAAAESELTTTEKAWRRLKEVLDAAGVDAAT